MKPSQVYTHHTREHILAFLKKEGYRISAFRAPRGGDIFLYSNVEIVGTYPHAIVAHYGELSPRLILTPIYP